MLQPDDRLEDVAALAVLYLMELPNPLLSGRWLSACNPAVGWLSSDACAADAESCRRGQVEAAQGELTTQDVAAACKGLAAGDCCQILQRSHSLCLQPIELHSGYCAVIGMTL